MVYWKDLTTVFNCWNFYFITTQWWAIIDFVTQNGPIFHKIVKIFVVINQKVCGQKLVWVVSTIGTTNTISFIKIREVTQNSLLIWSINLLLSRLSLLDISMALLFWGTVKYTLFTYGYTYSGTSIILTNLGKGCSDN